MAKRTRPYVSNCLIEAVRLLVRGKCNQFVVMTGTPLHFGCFDRDGNFWHFRRVRCGLLFPLCMLGRVQVVSAGQLDDRKQVIFEKRVLWQVRIGS